MRFEKKKNGLSKEDLKELIDDTVSKYENQPDVDMDVVIETIADKIYTELNKTSNTQYNMVTLDNLEPLLDDFVEKLKGKAKLDDEVLEDFANRFAEKIKERLSAVAVLEDNLKDKPVKLKVGFDKDLKTEEKGFFDGIFNNETDDTQKDLEENIPINPNKPKRSLIGEILDIN